MKINNTNKVTIIWVLYRISAIVLLIYLEPILKDNLSLINLFILILFYVAIVILFEWFVRIKLRNMSKKGPE